MALFFESHGSSRRPILLRATCLHLNEGQHSTVTCNQINLSKPTAVISLQNSVAMLAEVLDGGFLPCFADCMSQLSHIDSPSAPLPER